VRSVTSSADFIEAKVLRDTISLYAIASKAITIAWCPRTQLYVLCLQARLLSPLCIPHTVAVFAYSCGCLLPTTARMIAPPQILLVAPRSTCSNVRHPTLHRLLCPC
jgi:hypothetical protein